MKTNPSHGRFLTLTGALALGALLAGLPPAGAGAAEQFSDEAIGQAIGRGAKFLLSQQRANGSWPSTNTNHDDSFTVGPTAICTYALLESGVAADDPNIARALKFLRETKTEMTYCLAFRALAYAAVVEKDPRYRPLLRQDVRTLVLSIDRTGGYAYHARGEQPKDGDFPTFIGGAPDASNTQYGLLGVWAGALLGEEIPAKYWELSLDFWLKRQNADGGWGYSPAGRKESYLAMTLAGLASVHVCADKLFSTRFLGCKSVPGIPAAKRAMEYLETNFDSIRTQGGWWYYTLYGIERVALATGYKFIGKYDWYRVGVSDLLQRQAAGGSWTMAGGNLSGGACSTTSYAMLFLLRGRRPVMVNRLEYEGDWNNRPRALANLTRWFSNQFERDVHWQIIRLESKVRQWHDAPLLCITGATAPKFTDEQLDKVRTFVHQGGTIFSVGECAGKGFRDGMREVYGKLFPGRKLTALPPGHDIYKIHYPLTGRPALLELSNGARPLAIHTDEDLTRYWQADQHRTASIFYKAAANIVAYTNDRIALAGGLRSRGTSLWPAPYNARATLTVPIVRVSHGGNDDPEPLALERFARLMGHRRGIKIQLLEPADATELAQGPAKLALITGTGELKLADAQSKALKAWIEAGGTLFLDAAGGDEQFAASAEKVLQEMFGARSVRPLAGSAKLYALKGLAIEKVAYRWKLRQSLGNSSAARLRCVVVGDRPAVYFSREDVTCGLLGNPSYTVSGYEPESAFAILRNVVVEASGAKAPPKPPGGTGPKPGPGDPPGTGDGQTIEVTASASVKSADAAKAVDGDPKTRWDTGRPMKAGDWFTIDLGRAASIKRVVLDSSGSQGHHMRGFKMMISPDGMRWQKGLEKKNNGSRFGVTFPGGPRLRYIRFELTEGHATNSWSIHEVQVQAGP